VNVEDADDAKKEDVRLRVELSASLKRELITGWEKIKREGKLLALPRNVTVSDVLSRYEEETKAKAKSPEHAAQCREIAHGLKAYFDGALRSSLLYAEEKKQAEAVLGFKAEGKSGEKAPSLVYGAEHFLRLFVILPELVPLRDMDAAAAKAVQVKLTEVLRWMQRNASAHFGGEYVDGGAGDRVAEEGDEPSDRTRARNE
jgi:mortality factor 4-like protein 1